MKNEVAGVAGAARIKNVDRAGLARAEKHGKRLDETGKSRAVNDEPPVTTTGLDLRTLFDRHIEGAFVPKAKSSAMHLLIQFPVDLVDGADAEYMLHHARAFAERVFGGEAIFADRVDRDETSQRVVDLFLAPRYMKTTKRESKPAVSTTLHLKLLAAKHGEKPLPFGYGRALQTALFEYMRDEMKLDGVERGKAKVVPGQDWKSAEQQRAEELAGLTAQAQADIDQAEQDKAAVRTDRVEAERQQRDRETAFLVRQAEAARQQGDREQALAERERRAAGREQELKTRDTATEERERAVAAREADGMMAVAQAEIARREADHARIAMNAALQAAQRNVEDSAGDRAAARKELTAAEADRARAAAERNANTTERNRIDVQRKLEEAQLALLSRGADDAAGLELRPSGDRFSMRKVKMRPHEQIAYEAGWSAPMMKLARRLADAMEQVRNHARRLLKREQELNDRDAALTAREQDDDRDRRARASEHAAALADLDQRARELDAREDAASVREAEADSRIADAAAREADAGREIVRHNRWALAVDAIIDHPDWIDVTGNTIRLDRNAAATIDPKLVATLQETPPNWAMNVILARLDVADRHRLAEEHEADAARSRNQLTELVLRAGRVLSPDQQKVAVEVQTTVQRSATAAQAWNAARGTGR